MDQGFLHITELKKNYDSFPNALTGVNLQIQKGDFFALLGPNGAGKSTIINIIAQTIQKTSGEVLIGGKSIDTHPQECKMMLGVMPQEVSLDSFFTTKEVLQNHSGYYGITNNDEYIEELLNNLGLWKQRDANVHHLSGGMKRRLMVAKALVHKPQILILDEPTAGVDVEFRQILWEYMKKLHKEGLTIILTTHYLEEAQTLAKNIAIITNGNIIAQDSTQKLLKNFGNKYFEVIRKKTSTPLPSFLQPFVQEQNEKSLSGIFSMKESEKFFRWLAENYHDLEDIKIEEPRLEEVFLTLTSKQKEIA